MLVYLYGVCWQRYENLIPLVIMTAQPWLIIIIIITDLHRDQGVVLIPVQHVNIMAKKIHHIHMSEKKNK